MTRFPTSAGATPAPINRFPNKTEARSALPLAQRIATRDTRDRLAVEPIVFEDGGIQYAIAVYSGITGVFQRYY